MSHYLIPEPSPVPLQERNSGANSCETIDENYYEEFSPKASHSSGRIAQTVNQQFPDRYQRPGTVSVNSPQQPPGTALAPTDSTANFKSDQSNCKWKAVTLIALFLAVAAAGFSTFCFFRERICDKETLIESSNKIQIINNMNEFLAKEESCQGLRSLGYSASGFYEVFVGPKQQRITVYCDMESDGGGWTLVASMNDKSFHDQCPNIRSWVDGRTWLNNLTFGSIENIPAKEYKNAAFYSLEATDVMIWHIPNQAGISRLSEQALLKYHTDDHFLQKYQWNLRSLFLDSLQLTLATDFIKKISSSANRMQAAIPDWYNYTYDVGVTGYRIHDGGNDMYDDGNMITLFVDDHAIKMQYGSTYTRSDLGYSVTSLAIHPFTMLAWVENSTITMSNFSIQVSSDLGANGGGNYTSNAGSDTNGDISIKYKYFQVYNASDPSVCEVYFAITNSEWKSSADVTLLETWSNSTNSTKNTMTFTNMRNALVGYVLLSRTKGEEVTPQQVRSVMTEVAYIAGSVRLPGGIEVNVTFVKGSVAEISSSLSGEQTRNVQPGYIEFKAMDRAGDRYALCPGVRILNNNGQRGLLHFCFGKLVSSVPGLSCPVGTTSRNRSSSSTLETIWLNNQTSILIFTRNFH